MGSSSSTITQPCYSDPSSSSSSSPPTPPTPLPISVGPGHHKYCFSSSPTPTPPFSPPLSAHSSFESPLLLHTNPSDPLLQPAAAAPLAFSLDYQAHTGHDSKSSCLKDLLEWLVLKCCRHCSLCL